MEPNLDYLNKRVFFAVGQRPFEVQSNTFATLIPLLHEDGAVARPDEFAHMGDVWWMLRPQTRPFAEPGRVLVGRLQTSPHHRDTKKAVYQVEVGTIEPILFDELVEVVDVPADLIRETRGMVDARIPVDHPPADIVYARWKGNLHGPFRTSVERHPERPGWRLVQLTPTRSDSSISVLPEEAFPKGALRALSADVSMDDKPIYQGGLPHECRYLLTFRAQLEQAVKDHSRTLVLEPDHAIVARAAKNLMTRRDRQTLRDLMAKLEEAIVGSPQEARPDDASRVREVLDALRARDADDEALARALVDSGLLEERIRVLNREAEERHVLENSARLEAEIEEKIKASRENYKKVEAKLEKIEAMVEKEKNDRLKDLDKELATKRQQLAVEEKRIAQREAEIDARAAALEANLDKVASRMSENSQEIVNQFLTMAPLLAKLGVGGGGGGTVAFGGGGGGGAARESAPGFHLPPYVTTKRAPRPLIDESKFFERFRAHVEASGFRHRRIDLVAFHLSVKCTDLVILGGLPGTGKSSLPRLYAEAILGDDHDGGRERHLHVGVSPSWLDMRDLLGHVNTLDHDFQPAESGLYPHLIRAMEEHLQHGENTGIYTVLLDEMNLSHVEHYFSGFIQALELPPGRREIRCFSPEVVSPASPFAKWPVLDLPRSLRFIGTVNFDETTKQLSQRVLDRANLVRLNPSIAPDAREPQPVKPSGTPIGYRTYHSWLQGEAKIDAVMAETIDRLKEPLAALGCPMNPRRTQAIYRFIGNAPSTICTPIQALDLQIAQRLMPQVRGLFRPEARKAIEAVTKILEARGNDFPEALRALDEAKRSEGPGILFDEG